MDQYDVTTSEDQESRSTIVDLGRALVMPVIVVIVLLMVHAVEAVLGPIRG